MESGHGYVPVEKLIINFSSPGSGGRGGGVVGMGEGVGVGGASGCVGVGEGAGASEGGASVRGVAAASVGKRVRGGKKSNYVYPAHVCVKLKYNCCTIILADLWLKQKHWLLCFTCTAVFKAKPSVRVKLRYTIAQYTRFILQPMP